MKADDAAGGVTALGNPPWIVGMGASAGGLQAFQDFLRHMSAESDFAFVLVQHLDPSHESMMSELLGRRTSMPVRQVEGGERVEAGHVYVIPPNALLSVEDGRLTLSDPPAGRHPPSVIDEFFESLARDRGRAAIAIVLSGTGSDGSRGLRAVKEHGGLTIAQAVDSAKYGGMPRSAVATGYVDYVLPVEEIPATLHEYVAHLRKLHDGTDPEAVRRQAETNLDELLSELYDRTGHNFRQYKEATLIRRIERRLQVRKVSTPEEYLELLKNDPDEPRRLLQDLLIGVTRFFRDREAFDRLAEDVIPELFERATRGGWIRVWVPGCASGEEAYSLAVLLLEERRRRDSTVRLQIFATDIDDRALAAARQGVYSSEIEDDVPPDLLQRYFVAERGGYTVDRVVRDVCIFSPHSIIEDPPFSQVGLVSCRNLLIYMTPDLQKQVLSVIHYALGGDGHLFLGRSEGISAAAELFEPIDKGLGIYSALENVNPPLSFFPHSISDRRRKLSRRERGIVEPQPAQVAERIVLDEFAPAAVVVDSDGQVLRYLGRTEPYLAQPGGEPTRELLELVRRGLRTHVRSAFHQARKTRRLTSSGGKIGAGASARNVDVVVRPVLSGSDEPIFVIVFHEEDRKPVVDDAPEAVAYDSDDPEIRQLEDELRTTREHLQSTVEELETSNEELRSSNEELIATNEELQSTNEELQSSQEELRSVNEELETVNTELAERIDELRRANVELKNLYESTNTATLFLDGDGRIASYTPDAQELFRVREADVGRPIGEIRHQFEDEDIDALLEGAESSEGEMTRELRTSDGRWYLGRRLPFRSEDGRSVGRTLTFVDITGLKNAELEISGLNARLEQRVDELSTILDVVPVGVFIADDRDCDQVRMNRRAAELLGRPADDSPEFATSETGPGIRAWRQGEFVPPDELPLQAAARTGEARSETDLEMGGGDDRRVEVRMEARPLCDESGEVVGAVASFQDMTVVNLVTRELRARHRQQRAVAELGLAAIGVSTLEELFDLAVETIAEVLEIPFAKVLELLPGGDAVLLRSGVGWEEGLVGHAHVGTGTDSQAGYTLVSDQPVVVRDLTTEARFSGPPLLTEHGVRSGMSVIIRGRAGPWGVLGAHTNEIRDFSPDDVNFLVAVANVLARAIEQHESDAEVRVARQKLALQEAQDRLRRAERLASLGTLAAGIAHEINNPLTAIVMSAEHALLALGSEEDGKQDGNGDRPAAGAVPHVRTLIREAERCGQIVRTVLRFAKEDAAERRVTDLNRCLEEAIQLAGNYAKGDRSTFEVALASELPPVEINEAEIIQVFLNIMQNAIESRPGPLRVRVSSHAAGDEAVVRIQDNGHGIDANVLPRIFDPFFSTRRERGGTGLGLSLAHTIVKEHGGRLEVRSEPGVGSTFSIHIPCGSGVAG